MRNQEKYFYTFKSLDGNEYRCEIWVNQEDVLTPVEIRGDADPFLVTFPKFERFEPVRGSGCQMNLLSRTDREFLGLYTSDMFGYQIRLKRNGTVCWIGYLDSELYSEPFAEKDNYTVNLTGTDGLALLERLNYVDSNGDHYEGIVSQWTVISNILGKLGLFWNAIYVNISTTSPSITIGATETIFHQKFQRNDNWYNEDGNPETCRKVLEEILRPYGAFLIISNNNLYITDYNTIYEGTSNFKKYDSGTFAYVATTSVNTFIGDLSAIGFANASQNFSIVSGINKQVVKYSPYKKTDLIDFNAEKDNYQTVNAVETNGTGSFAWSETYYNTSDTFDRTALRGFFCKLNGTVEGVNDDTEDYYLKNITEVDNVYNGSPSGVFNEGSLTFEYKGELSTLVSSSNDYAIKVELSVYPVTKSDLNNPDEVGTEIGFINLFTDLIIGDKKYNYHVPTYQQTTTNGWKTLAEYGHLDLPFYVPITNLAPYSNIADNWTTLKRRKTIYTSPSDYIIKEYDFLVPLPTGLTGDLQFKIYGYTAYNTEFGDATNFYNLRIKDIKFTVVDSKGNAVDKSDIEFTGYLNKQFKNEGETITLFNGTNYNDFPTERGALLASTGGTYFNVHNWTRAGVTDNIENLLLRSIESNYANPSFELSMSINKIDNIVGYLTYENYLQQTFIITSCTHNFADATSEIIITEATSDSITIEPSF